MRVAIFATCLVDALFPNVGIATVELLERLEQQVSFPVDQSCCGQMHVNTGYPREAVALVQNHVAAFADFDAVVAPSGSCVASTRHQHAHLAERYGGAAVQADVAAVAGRTYELTEFLVDVLGVTDVGAYFPHRVTYHPTCHSLRLLRVGDRPLRLLGEVDGLDLVELPAAESCCGFGGTFAVKNSDVSAAMLADKVAAIERTNTEYCVAGDASCLMHIGGSLARSGSATRPLHIAEILAATR